ncbi:aromatic amino acid lyase [Nocardioides convexus]|uniref:aromatic amino acid lyase n=1 Tax=Nocardioides convexus TaxID=2712224 RepID=UPI0024188BBB|nr:aromatic amino acid lyase [Nocardioides convexus]
MRPASRRASLAAAVDNPVVLADESRVESNGNFHGAPVAYVLDFLAIVAADVASIAERRTDRFLDKSRNHGLPPFLADDPGVDSGLMIAQYTQAAIVSELKRLAVPASVDSIPSSAMQEDHVSMGWSAARKACAARSTGCPGCSRSSLMTAARGLNLRAPLTPGPGTGAVVDLLRDAGVGGPGTDRFLAPEIDTAHQARHRPRRHRRRHRRDRRTRMTNPRLPIHAATGTEPERQEPGRPRRRCGC